MHNILRFGIDKHNIRE